MDEIEFIYAPSFIDDVRRKAFQRLIESKPNKKWVIATCGKVVNRCSVNLDANPNICRSCAWAEKDFVKTQRHAGADIEVVQLSGISVSALEPETALRFSSVQDVKDYEEDGIAYGMGAVSTFVSVRRAIPEKLNTTEHHLLSSLIVCSRKIRFAFEVFIKKFSIKNITIFNGRYFDVRTVFELCKQNGVNVLILELAGQGANQLISFQNNLPHAIQNYNQLLESNWENGDSNKYDIGDSFYHLRRNGDSTNDRSHTLLQARGIIPSGLDTKKTNIAIFTSSEDELFAIGGEWDEKDYKQLDCIKAILKSSAQRTNVHFYIRLHPNYSTTDNNLALEIESLKTCSDLCSIIDPKSKVDSYALIDACNKIITFGSTIGIEATYWGKPSLLIGPSFYKNTGAVYTCRNLDMAQALDFIDGDRPALPVRKCIPYGYFQMNRNSDLTIDNIKIKWSIEYIIRKWFGFLSKII